MRIVALGDSLTTGLGLPANQAFPARLAGGAQGQGDCGRDRRCRGVGRHRRQRARPARLGGAGQAPTASSSRSAPTTCCAGSIPALTRKALDEILRRLGERKIPVLLAGMRAAPNFGADFGKRFEAIYPELAASYGVLLYPFLLDGVAADAKLNQRDGIHPSAAGVDRMVAGILPKVEELVARIRQKRPP